MRGQYRPGLIGVAASLAALGCGADVVDPSPELVAGTYVATTWKDGGNDLIADGWSLTLTLTNVGSMSGSITYPPYAPGYMLAVSGTYTISAGKLTFIRGFPTGGPSVYVWDSSWTWNSGGMDGVYGSMTIRMERT